MTKVSVIVPIYNVEKYFERCICSLFQQTLVDVEFIFIDDASCDDSINILYKYIKSFPSKRVTIVKHESNQGLAAARNSGLNVAIGEYIFNCDSDDWLENNALEELYNIAKKTNADVTWCDWYLSYGKRDRYMKEPEFVDALGAIKGILSGTMKYNVWNKLVRRSLYQEHNINFPSGYNMGEDMTMIRIFAYAGKVAYVQKALYHYNKVNYTAYSNTYSDKHLEDLAYNANNTIEFLKKNFGNTLVAEIAYFKLEIKFPFLTNKDRKRNELWSVWYPEANDYILKNKSTSFHRKAIQWLALKRQFWLIRLYFMFVDKILIRILYK